MIRRSGEYRTEQREEMRGGKGTVTIEHFWEPKTEMRSHTRMCAKLIRGTAEADDNGEVVQLGVGDTLLTGNGDGHAIRCTSGEPLELLAVIATY